MPDRRKSECKFNSSCERVNSADGNSHRPFIGRSAGGGCPFPTPVVDLEWAKGEHLFHQGDKVKGAFSLRTGLVALERLNEQGEMVVIKMLQPGAFFPCADLFSDGAHSASGRALADSTACFIPSDRLLALIAQDPKVGVEMVKRGCEEARENEEIIFRLCSGDLAERVLGILDSLAREAADPAEDGSVSFTLPFSWRDLANMVGTSPEVLSRLLRKMSDAGRLGFSGRVVTLAPPAEDDLRAIGQ